LLIFKPERDGVGVGDAAATGGFVVVFRLASGLASILLASGCVVLLRAVVVVVVARPAFSRRAVDNSPS
jgi:hypothetical protein